MKTIIEIIKLSADYLNKQGIATPRREADDLIADALDLRRMDLYLQHDRPLTDPELEKCRVYLQRRAKGEPLQYIRGEVEFAGCKIIVNKDVLIPRQETEILVEMIANSGLKEGTLWDLCCGSGCIGIALKKKCPQLDVFASDLSPAALAIAKENAQKNEVNVHFLQGDLFEPFKNQKAQYIVCNPPYISETEYQTLDKEVRGYEPKMALVGGSTGLEFYERMDRELSNYLYPEGKAWMEIGYQQGQALQELFQDSCWKTRQLLQDWSGKDRFFLLENS